MWLRGVARALSLFSHKASIYTGTHGRLLDIIMEDVNEIPTPLESSRCDFNGWHKRPDELADLRIGIFVGRAHEHFVVLESYMAFPRHIDLY